MKKAFTQILLLMLAQYASAQNWGTTGNSGLTTSNFLGTTDAKDVIFKANNTERGRLVSTGFWRLGSAANFAKIDSAGKLTFGGNGAYQVAGNKYAFQYTGNPNYGLFFNSTNVQYEFRNGSATPVFYVNANNGNSVFNGTLKIGAYTLPATDGTNGQVLKTNGSGSLSWSNDNGGASYIAGNSIDITGNVISVPFLKTDGNYNTAVGQYTLSNPTGSYNTANGSESLYSITTGQDNTANGAQSLYSNTAGSENTANGAASLYSNTTGINNIGNGSWTLYSNTTGNNNTASGTYSLYANTSGFSNTANGYQSLYNNTTGNDNTATGVSTLVANTTGNYNSATASNTLYSNTTGSYNVANGYKALFSNTTGNSNIAIGMNTLYANTEGQGLVAIGDSALYYQGVNQDNVYENTAVGSRALLNNTTGSSNTGMGQAVLYSNTIGGANAALGVKALYSNTTGSWNVANGVQALYSNTTGFYNIANGFSSLINNTTGNSNTGVGLQSLFYNGTGNNNAAVGANALMTNTTGSNNTALGSSADVSTGNLTNATAIGNAAVADASNKVRIGNSSVTSIGGQVGWTSFSDGRYKKNIKEDVKGLAFINALRPVTYTLDLKAVNKYYNKGRKLNDSAYQQMKASMAEGEAAGSKIIHTGFIAQEVEAAANKLDYDFDGVDKPQTKDGVYGLRYGEFVVPLVKAVQELSKVNDVKNGKIDSLQNRLSAVEDELKELKSLVSQIQQTQQQCSPCAAVSSSSAGVSNQYVTLTDAAMLEQNVPNPFTNVTTIGYTLPQKFTSAKIIVTDKNGRQLKQLNLTNAGKGTVTVDASLLTSGAYNYSLYLDGRLITTKQMERLK